MRKFKVETTFSLETEVEADLEAGHLLNESPDDLADDSYFGSASVQLDGGRLSFTVEAEDEHDALSMAESVLSDGNETEDGNGFTWVAVDVSHEIEAIEMSRDEALSIIQRLIERLTVEGMLTAVEAEAFDLLLQDL
jgi:hypothetical protein